MQPLITGSLAFDYIMRADGRFAERLPSPLHAGFSAAFAAPTMRRALGGCAGNIAYGLQLLGNAPHLLAVVGEDFGPYREYLSALGIDDSGIKTITGFFTAQAHIINDDDNSQLILFHAGACAEAHQQSIHHLPSPPPLAIVSPNGREGMLRFGRELAEIGTPFIFDPGQAIGLFSGGELETMMKFCDYAIFNIDEFTLLEKMSGISLSRAAAMTQALIITHGENGSEVYADDQCIKMGAAKLGETKDPTGCGDAYRAGLMHGMLRNWPWRQSMAFAAVVAGVKATHNGGQGYHITAAEAEHQSRKLLG